MLIDLERNDLGRVAKPAACTVDEYMVTESLRARASHRLERARHAARRRSPPWTRCARLFPGGTITGCPKVRCMQIIAELEGEGRGAYTGSLGWLGTDGDADFNILIRTLTLRGDQIELRAGAGIVADSVPERELEETRAKARGMLRAFERHVSDAARHAGSTASRRRRCRRTIADCTTATDCSRPSWCAHGRAAIPGAHLARLARGLRATRDSVHAMRPRCARTSRARSIAGAAARHPQDHRHARQRERRGYAPQALERRAASCRCGPPPALPGVRCEGVELRVAPLRARRKPRARRHQTSQPARERDGRRRSSRRAGASSRCCSMPPGTSSRGAMSNVFLVRRASCSRRRVDRVRRRRRHARRRAARMRRARHRRARAGASTLETCLPGR